jgi:hypothetical protein
MESSIEALTVFVYLMPGFISGLVLKRLADRRHLDTAQQCIEALIFSFLIYAMLAVFVGEPPVAIVTPSGEGSTPTTVFNSTMVLPILALAILLPCGAALCINNDIPHKWLRQCRLTKFASQETVWTQALAGETQCYITVHMKNGDMFYGWPTYYSASEDEPCLYLTNPYIVLPDKTFTRMNAGAILLKSCDEIYFIEFHPDQLQENTGETNAGE